MDSRGSKDRFGCPSLVGLKRVFTGESFKANSVKSPLDISADTLRDSLYGEIAGLILLLLARIGIGEA